jgi:2-keto-4-pentenoate hydratase/2-oxohepta-3-ene-1,7-dioic acid hydratase in catechol pathway
MKLLRYGGRGNERPGILDQDGHIRDLSSLVRDIDGETLSDETLAWLQTQDFSSLPIVPNNTRLGPCVGSVGNIICIGLNYEDHAREANLPIPEEPVMFMKATSAISGPYDDVIRPRGSDKMDWEVELALVIGKRAAYVTEEQAEEHIAGYCIANDLSERAFQFERGGQWDKGKSCRTFAPIGPWMVTRDEAGDMSDRALWLEVNGHRYQDGTTAYMIFRPAFIIHYVSQFMTLMPGDIVITGTPSGVGFGLAPPVFLQPGDVMTLGIDGLGQQQTKVIEASE